MDNSEITGGLPGAPENIPGFPENAILVPFEGFDGLNTKPLRPAIQDQEMAWCDGWMPLGRSNLRTLYGVGEALYTASGVSVVFFAFGNIADTAYCYALLSDGSIKQIDVSTGAVTAVMASGTIQNPSTIFGLSQWATRFIVFSAAQDNGYWLWDGSHLFTAGTIGPIVTLTNSGKNYTFAPTITLTTTGSGTGATFSATLENDVINNIQVTNPGSGFGINDYVLLNISGGGSDNPAKATATVNTGIGVVTSVTITNPGHGYDTASYITASGGGASTQATFALVSNVNGTIVDISVVTPGVGYTSAPTLTPSGGSGGDLAATANVSYGVIVSVAITDGGSGYKSAPTVTVLGDGKGASLKANINNAGVVTSVDVINGGYGYTKALIKFTGGNNAASGEVQLMPFGISGTTVETYQGRVWVGSDTHDIPKGIFSAPNDPANFKVSDGAGAFPATDAFLRVAYQRFIQSNGFLYLMGDSSMNYISGVNTSAADSTSNPTTTFNNLNVDPQIGTPWPQSVQVFSRNIVFANLFGVHVSYGGAVQKISQPLDGIYNSVITSDPYGSAPTFYPSSAIASIFGIQVYMLLMPIIDSYTGQQVNKLLMWDGKKWWTSPQDVNLTFIATQEINSLLTAWGTDGTSIYPLFQTPTDGFAKVVQSKLWATPTYLFKKTATHVAGLANFYSFSGTMDIAVDNEFGQSFSAGNINSPGAQWLTVGGDPVTWTTVGGDPVIWLVPGLALLGPQYASQNGALLGLTISTEAKDVALLSITLVEQNYSTKT